MKKIEVDILSNLDNYTLTSLIIPSSNKTVLVVKRMKIENNK